MMKRQQPYLSIPHGADQWWRVVVVLLFCLAGQLLAAIAYITIRYGPTFRPELWRLPLSSSFVALTSCVTAALMTSRMIPPEKPLRCVALVVFLGDVVGGAGIYSVFYLLERAGMHLY